MHVTEIQPGKTRLFGKPVEVKNEGIVLLDVVSFTQETDISI